MLLEGSLQVAHSLLDLSVLLLLALDLCLLPLETLLQVGHSFPVVLEYSLLVFIGAYLPPVLFELVFLLIDLLIEGFVLGDQGLKFGLLLIQPEFGSKSLLQGILDFLLHGLLLMLLGFDRVLQFVIEVGPLVDFLVVLLQFA